MRFSATVAAVAATISAAEAAKAYVYNHCSYPVYLWAVDTSRAPSAPTTVAAGGSWSEDYHSPPSGGVSVKMSKTTSAALITQFEYTLSPGMIWYDGSNIDCDNGADCPFTGESMLLMSSKTSCPTAACSRNTTMCTSFYNQPSDDWATLACDQTADTEFHICLPDAQMPGGGSAVENVVAPVAAAVTSAVAVAAATPTLVTANVVAAAAAAPVAAVAGRPLYVSSDGTVHPRRHLHHARIHGQSA